MTIFFKLLFCPLLLMTVPVHFHPDQYLPPVVFSSTQILDTSVTATAIGRTALKFPSTRNLRLGEPVTAEARSINHKDQATATFLLSSDISLAAKDRNIGKLYFRNKRYKKAGEYFQRALKRSITYSNPQIKVELYLLLFKTDSAAGNYQAAFNYYQHYKKISDSVFSAVKIQRLNAVTAVYDGKVRETLINANHSKSGRNWISWLFMPSVLIISGFLLYKILRSRSAKNDQTWLKAEQIRQKEEALKILNHDKLKLLIEKDELLKEVHHRVKNNFQIIMSLLNSQSAYLSDGLAKSAIWETQSRLQTMIIVHKKLYEENDVTLINMSDFVQELIDFLKANIVDESLDLHVVMDISAVCLDAAQAVLTGLIINEAVTQAVKLGWRNKSGLEIKITLGLTGNNHVQLAIGFPHTNISPKRKAKLFAENSLLLQLCHQLNGNLHVRQVNDADLAIEFCQETEKTLLREQIATAIL